MLAKLKKMTKSKEWSSDAVLRWRFGRAVVASKLSDAHLEKQLGVSEGTIRHARHAAENLTNEKQASKILTGCPIRSIQLISMAKTRKQLAVALATLADRDLDSIQAANKLRQGHRGKKVPRLRGDGFEDLTKRAEGLAAACTEFDRLIDAGANVTKSKRKKLVRALDGAIAAAKAAKKSAHP